MIEDDFIAKDLSIVGPVAAMRTVSHDPTLQGHRRLRVCLAGLHVDRAPVGVPPACVEVRRRDRSRGVADPKRSARWCSIVGKPSSAPARVRSRFARRPARLGHEARAPGAPTPSATTSAGTTPSSSCSRCSTTMCGRAGRCTRNSCAVAGSSVCSSEDDVHLAHDGAAVDAPGPTSGASASPAGPTPWWRRTGTA